jgi:hypothetical protein
MGGLTQLFLYKRKTWEKERHSLSLVLWTQVFILFLCFSKSSEEKPGT